MKKILPLILFPCVLAACSSGVDMTYNSDPAGASIYEDGMGKLGVAPVTVRYSLTDMQADQGHFATGKVTAVWPSGAKVSVPSVMADINPDGTASYSFLRPSHVEGLEEDRTYAVTVERAHLVEPNVDAFQSFDHFTSCLWFGLIDASYADCD
jgi:hypothetical protein